MSKGPRFNPVESPKLEANAFDGHGPNGVAVNSTHHRFYEGPKKNLIEGIPRSTTYSLNTVGLAPRGRVASTASITSLLWPTMRSRSK